MFIEFTKKGNVLYAGTNGTWSKFTGIEFIDQVEWESFNTVLRVSRRRVNLKMEKQLH